MGNRTNKKSICISIEGNDIALSKKGVTMFARLDTRRPNKLGTYPIRIRLIHNSVVRDYGTKQNTTKTDYEKITGERPKGIAADKKLIIISLLQRAFDVVKNIDPFNFTDFNNAYLNKQNNDLNNVFNWYDDKIKELKDNGQIGTAISYEYSKKSLIDYSGKEILMFDDINVKFLKEYEKWNVQKENSRTTVGIYLRPLRHIFARAIQHPSRFISISPFNKYKIPKTQSGKTALKKNQLKLIYEYQAPEGSQEEFYKDIWLFSYFANGINMKDICKLKYSNIKGNNIEFIRAKTKDTNQTTKSIRIVLTSDLNRIIEQYGTKPETKENYIFNFLKSGLNDNEELRLIKLNTRRVNKYIKEIAEKLEINEEVSTYTARHSFATILKNAGVAPAFIGESLGHTSLKTTESYLDSFEYEQAAENVNNLKDW